jgi:hypothetical protein
MRLRLALVSLTLAFAPAAGIAMCNEGHVKDSVSVCAAGQHWDAEKLQCVPTVSS